MGHKADCGGEYEPEEEAEGRLWERAHQQRERNDAAENDEGKANAKRNRCGKENIDMAQRRHDFEAADMTQKHAVEMGDGSDQSAIDTKNERHRAAAHAGYEVGCANAHAPQHLLCRVEVCAAFRAQLQHDPAPPDEKARGGHINEAIEIKGDGGALRE